MKFSSDLLAFPPQRGTASQQGIWRVGGGQPLLVVVPWVSLLALLAGWLLAPAALERLMYLPLLVSTVLFGIPHGALDHLVPGRLGWAWSRRPGRVWLYVLGYALLAAATLRLWSLVPDVVFWGFLLVSLLHWGQGDLHYLETVQGRRRSGPWSAPLTLLARGSLPILLPLLVFPEWYARLAAGVHHVFGLPTVAGPLLTGTQTGVLAAGLALLLLAYAADTLVSSPGALLELGETALLLAVFVVVPAPLSIGLYFSLWHAWRHLGRLLLLPVGPDASPDQKTGTARVLWLVLDLLPITLVALGLLAALYFWAAPRVQNTETFAALYLALIAALTLPHALLVALMDLPASKPAGT
ncbi:Brp/Blh family beta-carotene 15,15'-dioxygenase (plasmid) [Deinococcus radiomollis]|uniref:Brp/Blh family beta-carotene 15,15'-dioxygenase n=1 Tax=Deinococcus radiomollis TaxID=468916 RepID=UPI0038917394